MVQSLALLTCFFGQDAETWVKPDVVTGVWMCECVCEWDIDAYSKHFECQAWAEEQFQSLKNVTMRKILEHLLYMYKVV